MANVRALIAHIDLPLFMIELRNLSHAEELFAVMADPRLYDFVDKKYRPSSLQLLRERIANNETKKSPDGTEHWLNWIIRNDSGAVAGFVQATVKSSLEADIGYSISSSNWGLGLARRAVERVLQILSSEYRVEKFCIVAERANVRSIHLAERLGFSEAGAEASARHSLSDTEVLLQRSGSLFVPEP